jgi:hypothetical protein
MSQGLRGVGSIRCRYSPRYWFKRVMFDRAWLGTPSLHRERAAQLAGWSA